MSMHLTANVSLDSNATANADAIFQERIQMQMFWGRIQMQMFWSHICKCFELISNVLLYINVLFYLQKKLQFIQTHYSFI